MHKYGSSSAAVFLAVALPGGTPIEADGNRQVRLSHRSSERKHAWRAGESLVGNSCFVLLVSLVFFFVKPRSTGTLGAP